MLKRSRVRETGGGRFDRDEGFCYFVAGIAGTRGIADLHSHTLIAVNDLWSEPEYLDELLALPDQKVLFDSGVYWLATRHADAHGLTMDAALALPPERLDGWKRLRDLFVRLALKHEHDLWGVVELDQGGALHKRETRAWLEEQGLRPIPVYHPLNDGWDYLDELLDGGYDRIMIGNVVHASWEVRDRIVWTVYERVQRLPRAKRPWLHLLGLGPYPTIAACPFNSVDTSNHVQSMRYGALVPGGLAMGPFSKLRGYLYDTDVSPDDDSTGLRAYSHLLGWIASLDERSWRLQADDLAALLPGDPLPGSLRPVERPAPRPGGMGSGTAVGVTTAA